MNPGLRTNDHALFSKLSERDKLVLAAILSPTARDETREQLAARLPVNVATVSAARKSLEAKEILRLDRNNADRHTTAAVRWVAPEWDFRSPGSNRLLLTGEMVEQIVGGKPHGAAPALLLALLYVRCQLRRCAVHVSDKAAASDLGLHIDVIRRARTRLEKRGVIVRHGQARGVPIYVMLACLAPTRTR